MHIHINARRVELEKQHKSRVTTMKQHIAIGLPNSMGDQFVADHTTVHKEILQICLAPGKGRFRHPAPEPERARLALDRHRVLGELLAANGRDASIALTVALCRTQLQCLLAVVLEGKRHIRSGQGLSFNDLVDMAKLGFLGAQKLSPCGRVVKQITHLEGSAAGVRRRAHRYRHLAPLAQGLLSSCGVLIGIRNQD